jgi:hypothetical protein
MTHPDASDEQEVKQRRSGGLLGGMLTKRKQQSRAPKRHSNSTETTVQSMNDSFASSDVLGDSSSSLFSYMNSTAGSEELSEHLPPPTPSLLAPQLQNTRSSSEALKCQTLQRLQESMSPTSTSSTTGVLEAILPSSRYSFERRSSLSNSKNNLPETFVPRLDPSKKDDSAFKRSSRRLSLGESPQPVEEESPPRRVGRRHSIGFSASNQQQDDRPGRRPSLSNTEPSPQQLHGSWPTSKSRVSRRHSLASSGATRKETNDETLQPARQRPTNRRTTARRLSISEHETNVSSSHQRSQSKPRRTSRRTSIAGSVPDECSSRKKFSRRKSATSSTAKSDTAATLKALFAASTDTPKPADAPEEDAGARSKFRAKHHVTFVSPRRKDTPPDDSILSPQTPVVSFSKMKMCVKESPAAKNIRKKPAPKAQSPRLQEDDVASTCSTSTWDGSFGSLF